MFYDQAGDGASRTVTLTRKDISAVRRLLRLLLGAERQLAEALERDSPPSTAAQFDRSTLAARAHEEFQTRRRRIKVFGQAMFGEAAWDMLLALYVMDMSGPRHRVGDLMRLAGAPTTTANRWLGYLLTHGLVCREPHPTDARTGFVSLTDKGRTKMDEYLSGTLQPDM